MNTNLKLLNEYKTFLINLKKNIYFSSFSINEIIEKSEDEISMKIKSNNSWKNINLSLFADQIFINEKYKNNAMVFFSSLGRTDVKEQIENIEMQINYINQSIIEEKKDINEKTKINLSLYFFISVVFVLVIV